MRVWIYQYEIANKVQLASSLILDKAGVSWHQNKRVNMSNDPNLTVKMLEDKLSHIKAPITLSIIGCVVNGPGEAALTDIGITGGGKGNSMLYLKGVQTEKLSNDDIVSKIVELVEKKAAEIQNTI